MNAPGKLSAAITVVLLLTLAVPLGDAGAQSAKSLVGTWSLVSSDSIDGSGTKSPVFGPNPRGLLILTSDGSYSLWVGAASLPKFASNNRAKGTAEENQAVVAGSIAHFGSYTVDEKDTSLNFNVKTSTFANWDGTIQKRVFTVSSDELKYTNPAGSAGGGRVDLVWKRVK